MITYGTNAAPTEVRSDDEFVYVYTNGTCVLAFRHNHADDAAYTLIQLLTTEHGRSFDRLD